jgi:hypothetical protein
MSDSAGTEVAAFKLAGYLQDATTTAHFTGAVMRLTASGTERDNYFLAPGNFTPGSDVLCSLGSASFRWDDLWLDGFNGGDAAAGAVGQIIVSEVLQASRVSLTTNTAANVTSISLTAGDWDVDGNVCFYASNTTTYTAFHSTINTTSATLPTRPNQGAYNLFYTSTSLPHSGADETVMVLPTGTRRYSLSGTTTVYLVAQSQFLTAGMAAFGYIRARRVR